MVRMGRRAGVVRMCTTDRRVVLQVGYNTTYMPVLRAALDAAGFGSTKVLAADMFSGQCEAGGEGGRRRVDAYAPDW